MVNQGCGHKQRGIDSGPWLQCTRKATREFILKNGRSGRVCTAHIGDLRIDPRVKTLTRLKK